MTKISSGFIAAECKTRLTPSPAKGEEKKPLPKKEPFSTSPFFIR
ncbi:hypothetical protein [Rahnella sp. BIGb0236]|nr:hypothetical protein [Rahnella sp. BIGb0236]